jgi:hypothetical protein
MGPIRNPRWEQKWTEGYVIVSNKHTVATLEKFPFFPADAAIVANIPLADICIIY